MKKLTKIMIEQIIGAVNFLGFIYLLGIVGSLERFIEVTTMQWVVFVLVIIIYALEIKIGVMYDERN